MLSLLSLINADVNESASEASLSAQNSTYIYLTQPNFNQPNWARFQGWVTLIEVWLGWVSELL